MKREISQPIDSPEPGYAVYPVKTELITENSDIFDIMGDIGSRYLFPDDIVIIAEKALAISQGKAVKLSEISPRFLATFLSKFVTRSKHGIGLGMPETMEIALRECGIARILVAAFFSAFFKLFGIRGVFYVISGVKAYCIDGPTKNTIPPYNEYVVPGPDNSEKTAAEIGGLIGVRTLIVDINDIGGRILGDSHKLKDHKKILSILKNNPLGQDDEGTPIGIMRKIPQSEQSGN